MSTYDTPDGVMKRLKRIETKLTIAFDELGVGGTSDPDWLSVQDGTIFISTLNRSLQAIIDTAKQHGAKIGEVEYEVVHRGRVVAWL